MEFTLKLSPVLYCVIKIMVLLHLYVFWVYPEIVRKHSTVPLTTARSYLLLCPCEAFGRSLTVFVMNEGSTKLSILHRNMWWCDSRRTGSGISQRGDHSRCTPIRFYFTPHTFSAHPKWSLARIDNRAARAARKTRCCYNQISPLDHKMADICDFSARTSKFSPQ